MKLAEVQSHLKPGQSLSMTGQRSGEDNPAARWTRWLNGAFSFLNSYHSTVLNNPISQREEGNRLSNISTAVSSSRSAGCNQCKTH